MEAMPPQLNDFASPCPPTTMLLTLNHYDMVYCYCLLYVKEDRLKLSTLQRGILQLQRECYHENFPGGMHPDPLCCFSATIKDIGSTIANIEGVVIKTS